MTSPGTSTRTINRLRSILVQIFPSLERVFAGEILQRAFVLELLIHYAGPTKLKKMGRKRVLTWARNHTKKDPEALVDSIFQALGAQTVTVPGTAAAEVAIPMLATNIKSLKAQRESIAGQVEEMLDDFPLSQVLMSMPGVDIKSRAPTSCWQWATVPTSRMPPTWPPTLALHR